MNQWVQNMHASLNKISLDQWLKLYLLAALLIAAKVMHNQHGWINNDSLLYFEQARLLAEGEFKRAFTLYSWPFYSGLIALVHRISSLDLQTSAQCLNAVFFVIFVAGFQQLILAAGGQLRTLHWGHLLLFSTPYIVGDILGMLLRDEGFWAAYTWGLVFWLRVLHAQRWRDILLFQCSMGLAVLFRIEAAAYLLALPVLVLAYTGTPWPQRIKLCMRANLLAILCASALAMAVLFGIVELRQLGRLQEIFTQLARLFTERVDFINNKAAIISTQVLGEDLDQYGALTLWSSLILITVLKTLKVAGLPGLIAISLPGQTWWPKLTPATRQLAKTTLLVSFIVSVVIILNVFILSSRYVIASGIVMLALAAFALSEWQKKWPNWVSYLYAAALGLMLVNTLWDRGYLDLDRHAVNYVQSINTAQKPVFYDTENARFYAQQPYQNRILGRKRFKQLLINGQIEQYSLYMITISKDDEDIAYEQLATQTLSEHHFVLLKTIYGWHHKTKAMIFTKAPIHD